MPSATITPKYVNQPKPSKKYGSIKDENGEYWGCSPALLNQFQVGRPTTIDYKTSPREDGTEYKSITGVSGGGNSAANPPAAAGNGLQKDENIFVCGVVNNAIAYQTFPLMASELAKLAKMAREAWRESLKPVSTATVAKPVPREPDDFSDDIPF